MRRPGGLSWLLIVVSSACAPQPEGADEGAAGAGMAAAEPVVTSLEAEVGRDSARFTLHATNTGATALELEFTSSQRYDFAVQTPAGAEVWRWSAAQIFAQVLGTETIAPGQTVTYRAAWPAGGRSGTFVAVGRIAAVNRPIEQRTEFEIP